MVMAGEGILLQGGRGAGGHGTFGEQPKAQAARWPRAAAAAAAAVAVVLVVALAGFVSLQGRQPSELFEDDVTHDGSARAVAGRAARVRRGGLSAHSSIADFFHAAMRGDFEKNEGNVRLATRGLFDSDAKLDAPAKIQALASRRLSAKAVHMAHAGSAAVHRPLPARHALRARTQELPGGVVLHAARRVRGVSEKKWMFPSEDKFVARYTGALPRGDVVVDSFTNGPFTPL